MGRMTGECGLGNDNMKKKMVRKSTEKYLKYRKK